MYFLCRTNVYTTFLLKIKHLKIMESLNRIELRGNIGNIRFPQNGSTSMVNLYVATTFYFPIKDNPGMAKMETTWFSVLAFQSDKGPKLTDLKKGQTINVVGRMRQRTYVNSAGEEKEVYEIIASHLEIAEE